MKKFAFYLPQFHEIPENNEWWGKGFTEWTNVKNAKSLYKNHIQPKLPLDSNYYNLLDINTVKWQTDLLHKYRIDGFIYYHYYFTGRKLLEKPCENLLMNKDINQPFFFCWANHSWYRSWEGSKTLLIEQTYGTEEDWEKHFEYLLPFFYDSRYEKIDNQPVFMIFQCEFEEKEEMFKFFDKRCREEGFKGLYLIETFVGNYDWPRDLDEAKNNISSITKRIFIRQPSVVLDIYKSQKRFLINRVLNKLCRTVGNWFNIKKTVIYNGNLLYELIEKNIENDKFFIQGIFFSWDNTPRHKERGYIIDSVDFEHFENLMKKYKDNDYIFINAWNEWAEGMMLEPTELDGYKYLEWINKL